ncbi:LPXTG cell wall anchor domain-containing protein [Advenella sp. RU8]|uniref:LPXTG cell wall anchor domain-containing protein n=1 Tax=Advenella sp. RU8 TaxID=3399575 RepID=UPI003AADED21
MNADGKTSLNGYGTNEVFKFLLSTTPSLSGASTTYAHGEAGETSILIPVSLAIVIIGGGAVVAWKRKKTKQT